MPNPIAIAADTNVLLDLAAGDETVIDCFTTVKKKIRTFEVIVLPTVIIELTDIATNGERYEKRLAMKAFENLIHPWKFQPVNCIPVGHGIAERVAQKLRERGLIPAMEIHDSLIVAEAGLCGASILISSDTHLKDMDQALLKLEMDSSDVNCPLIASPWKIVHDFWPKA